MPKTEAALILYFCFQLLTDLGPPHPAQYSGPLLLLGLAHGLAALRFYFILLLSNSICFFIPA